MARVLSVTRSGAIGDSFEIELESNGCSSCQQYGAIQVNNVSANRCSCSCNDKKKRTFYTEHTGTMNCTEDRDILADPRDGKIFYSILKQYIFVFLDEYLQMIFIVKLSTHLLFTFKSENQDESIISCALYQIRNRIEILFFSN